jgi:plasmid stabilization system protein ParE
VQVTIKILEEADKEWTEAALWYEKQSPGLGGRFIELVEKKLELITNYPKRYPIRKGNFRETLVAIFPYIIVYTYYESEQIITVSSIFHASRNPKKKYARVWNRT